MKVFARIETSKSFTDVGQTGNRCCCACGCRHTNQCLFEGKFFNVNRISLIYDDIVLKTTKKGKGGNESDTLGNFGKDNSEFNISNSFYSDIMSVHKRSRQKKKKKTVIEMK